MFFSSLVWVIMFSLCIWFAIKFLYFTLFHAHVILFWIAEMLFPMQKCYNISASGDSLFFIMFKVSKSWKDSTLSKIVQLTEEGQLNKAKLQRWLDEFGEHYSKVVVALSLGVALLGPFLFKWPFIGSPGTWWNFRALKSWMIVTLLSDATRILCMHICMCWCMLRLLPPLWFIMCWQYHVHEKCVLESSVKAIYINICCLQLKLILVASVCADFKSFVSFAFL